MAAASPIVSPATLAERMGDPNLRVVDVRWTLNQPGAGRRAYDAGHIPGAISGPFPANVDAQAWS